MLNTSYVPGTPNWTDLATPDIEGAKTFYGGVFGWDYVPAGPGYGGYGMFQSQGKTVAGAMPVTPEQAPPSWTVYFETPDATATAEAVKDAGGTVAYEPSDVMDLGRMAVFADPAGAGFATWQPGANQGLDMVNEKGSLCWAELITPDPDAALAFYRAVYGWETTSMPMPEGDGDYVMVNPAGAGEEAMFAGVVPSESDPAPAATGPSWLLYFGVSDCDASVAKTRELGGAVALESMDVEGVGRFATVADPYGARIAFMQAAEQDL